MKPIIHIIGHEGILGSAMAKYLCPQHDHILHDRVDPVDPQLPGHMEGDWVINCAGALKPSIEEKGPEYAAEVNTLLPQTLSAYCEWNKLRLICFSSDCVYTGNRDIKDGGYKECDKPDAMHDIYAITKALGEPAYGMTLRTSFIGHESRDTPRGMLGWLLSSKGNKIAGYTNCYWNGVTALQLAKIVHTIITDRLYDYGLYHIHSPEPVTKYDLCNMVNDVYNLQLEINPVEAKYIMSTKITGTLNRTLDSEFEFCEKLNIPTILEQIKEQKQWRE